MFQEKVREIVGCHRVFGRDRQSLLISGLSLLPIASPLVDSPECHLQTRVARRKFDAALIKRNGLFELTFCLVELSQPRRGRKIVLVQFQNAAQRSFGHLRLLLLALNVGLDQVKRGRFRIAFDLLFNQSCRVREFVGSGVQANQTDNGVNGIWIALQRLTE